MTVDLTLFQNFGTAVTRKKDHFRFVVDGTRFCRRYWQIEQVMLSFLSASFAEFSLLLGLLSVDENKGTKEEIFVRPIRENLRGFATNRF